jgi:TonB family protein
MSELEGTLAGRVLAGRYLVETPIGRGGMGAVYRARDQRLGRPVALKVIMVPDADAATHERLRQRFVREAQAAAGLRHPNVVTVHDFGTDDALGVDYLVMELLEGEDLARRAAESARLPASAALAVVSQAARGLAAGHRTGMVHRDVKPGNLFLEMDEHGEVHVRVLDFGIAQMAYDEPSLTAGRDPLSPKFAAPEQLRGDARITPAADVFSLAAVALYLLNGERPFTGDASTQAAEAEAALFKLVGIPEATPAVREVLRQALAADPGRRYADANEFRRALEAAYGGGLDTLPASVIGVAPHSSAGAASDDVTLFADLDDRTLHAGAPVPAIGSGPARPVAPPAAPVTPRRPGVVPQKQPSRAPAVVAGLAVLAAAGGALAYMQPWEPREPEAPPVAAAPDSATRDSLARLEESDSLARLRRQQDLILAAVDSVRRADSLRRESERLSQVDTQALPGAGTLPTSNTEPPPADVYELSAVERAPQLRNTSDVRRFLERNYPATLRDSRIDGQVQLRFIIGTDGRAEMQSVQVVSSAHPAFEPAALRAVERMRFRPAQVGGRNVRVYVDLPIQFQTSG